MAKNSNAARRVFDEADRLMPELWGAGANRLTLSSLCFEGPEETLRQTVYAQPALYVMSAASVTALREAGVPGPSAVAGHSVGEYAALFAADVFDFETGLRLVTRRAQEMQRAAEASSGTMAAILGLDGAVVVEICEAAARESGEVVEAANFNSPTQIVISGNIGAVATASAMAKDRGAKRVMPLSVSGAFHSRLMAPAAEAMRSVLAEAALSEPSIQALANLTADFVQTTDDVRTGLVCQIDHPVRWHESMEKLVAAGFDTFVEAGHGGVLSGLMKRLSPGSTILQAGTPEDISKILGANI